MQRVYLDNCCLNRPFDDPRQDRIRLEVEAISAIVKKIHREELIWVASAILDEERAVNPDPTRRALVDKLFDLPHDQIEFTLLLSDRAIKLRQIGFKDFDAMHLAAAELGRCAVFLTTDDRLVARARAHKGKLKVTVYNPVDWIVEHSL